ncbi:TPA: hypothetical protein ACH3X2_013339 [Trebouxia sp. C0005]
MPSGIVHSTLQPQLFGFLQTLARFKFPAKHGISCWHTDAVGVQFLKKSGLKSRIFCAQAVQCARPIQGAHAW